MNCPICQSMKHNAYSCPDRTQITIAERMEMEAVSAANAVGRLLFGN